MDKLKRHPFPVVARFDRVLALSFAFPQELLAPLLPPGLKVDTHAAHGFVTVAMVWTKDLRPSAMPAMLGMDFFLAGYRIFTRLATEDGRHLRGLKILRSETDQSCMVWSGNLMTHYNYRRVNLMVEQQQGEIRVQTKLPHGESTLDVTVDLDSLPTAPPEGSVFKDLRAARLFAGPMPFTFDAEKDGRYVMIEGKRTEWSPRPVHVKSWKVGLFEETPFAGTTPVLANAFCVENVDYRWERGRLIKPMEVMHD